MGETKSKEAGHEGTKVSEGFRCSSRNFRSRSRRVKRMENTEEDEEIKKIEKTPEERALSRVIVLLKR